MRAERVEVVPEGASEEHRVLKWKRGGGLTRGRRRTVNVIPEAAREEGYGLG